MKMSKNYKRLCLVLSLGAIVGTGAVSATTGTKNLQATYRNIGVTYNGTVQQLTTEPFTVEGTTYLPLRAIGNILGAQVDWNGSTNTVAITSTGGDTTALQQQLATANYNLAVAQRDLTSALAELETYKSGTVPGTGSTTGTIITPTQLQQTETYLINNFSNELSNITFDFNLYQTGSKLDVTISYENRSEDTAFNRLSTNKIQDFIERIGDNIAVTHKDIEIEGIIEYSRDGEEKVSFTRSKTGRYDYTYPFDLSDIQDIIFDELGNYINFNSEIGNVVIHSIDADIRESKSLINAKIYLDLSNADLLKWNELTSYVKEAILETELEYAQDAVFDLTSYDYDVNITVYAGTPSTINGILAEIDPDSDVTIY